MSRKATSTSQWLSRSAWKCSTCACASAPPVRSSCTIATAAEARHLGERGGPFPEEYRQIGRRRAGSPRYLIEEIGDEAAVIARVVDDVEQDLRARHPPLVSADQGEVHVFPERGLGLAPAPGDVPVVDEPLLAPQLGQLRVSGGVACR